MWDCGLQGNLLEYYCNETPEEAEAPSVFEGRKESYKFVNYDINPTRVYKHIQAKEWNGVIDVCERDPHELGVWVYRWQKEDVAKLRWKLLPIHAAVIFKCPPNVLQEIMDAYPEGVEKTDDRGHLPLHLAVIRKAGDDIVSLLLAAYPDGLEQPTKSGWTIPPDLTNGNRRLARVLRRSKERGNCDVGADDEESHCNTISTDMRRASRKAVQRNHSWQDEVSVISTDEGADTVTTSICTDDYTIDASTKYTCESSKLETCKSDDCSVFTDDGHSLWSNISDGTQQTRNTMEAAENDSFTNWPNDTNSHSDPVKGQHSDVMSFATVSVSETSTRNTVGSSTLCTASTKNTYGSSTLNTMDSSHLRTCDSDSSTSTDDTRSIWSNISH